MANEYSCLINTIHPFVLFFCAYFILHGFLYYFLEKRHIYVRMGLQEGGVLINDEPHNGLLILTALMEYCILCRYSVFGYKNAVRANIRIFSSIGLTAFIVLVYWLLQLLVDKNFSINHLIKENQKVDVIVVGLTIMISSFIIERKILYEKWMYLARHYESMLVKLGTPLEYPLKVSLAIDLIDMEMWSHRSFKNLFYEVLERSFDNKLAEIVSCCEKENISKMKSDVLLGAVPIDKKEIRKLLSAYHEKVIFNSRNIVKKEFY